MTFLIVAYVGVVILVGETEFLALLIASLPRIFYLNYSTAYLEDKSFSTLYPDTIYLIGFFIEVDDSL